LSRTLQPAEKKWAIKPLEALGILWALEKLGYHFDVIIGHESLKWLMVALKLPRLVRWATRLSKFDFTIKHKDGVN
jgi:hypothetical protein